MIEVIRPPESQFIRRVVIVCHGLNHSSQNLAELRAVLASDSTIVIQLTLAGHSKESLLGVRPWMPLWLEELKKALSLAQECAGQSQAEIQFVGFSLGCLLFLLLSEEFAHCPFQRAIFLAPVLRLDLKIRILQSLGIFRVPYLPSFGQKKTRVHAWLPVSMYQALGQALKKLDRIDPDRWKIPILILMDPRDKVVRYKNVKNWITEKGWANWQFIPIRMDGPQRRRTGFHLMTDSDALGESGWNQLVQRVQVFLKNF